ncbi:VOC family protein [Vogesella facilis]|uniref:VOC family protein n=1 Tax=Vogesella facilis TaxID=1655232 RepID=A0ABV7RF05_9NEIS
MNIVGLDEIVFGVDDIAGCTQFLTDYGLTPVGAGEHGGRFEAQDGTAVVIARADDSTLPPALATGCMLRKTVMGVADAATLAAIADELGRDREVKQLADGAIETVDDSGFVIGFQLSVRKAVTTPGELSNAPGAALQRAANHLGVDVDAVIRPRSLSHIVYFVPDVQKAEAFYVERLGFRCTDRFAELGPFIQPAGTLDHHSHFLIGMPAHMQGVEHFTFHFAGPSEVMQHGNRFLEKGYQPFWGPGRHILGSNWFWYFNSPFGCHIEMDADMDLHDDSWQPRVTNVGADTSQAFLLQYRKKWAPGPGCPENGAYA